MMEKPDAVEEALTMLKAAPVEPPTDLYTRCLSTVPTSTQRQPWQFPWKEKQTMIRQFAFAGVLMAFILLWTAFPQRRTHVGRSVASVAFAQSVKATRSAPFWHKQVRQLRFDLGQTPNVPPTVDADWKTSEEWYDTAQGFVMRSETMQTLTLPSGDLLARGENTISGVDGMDIIHRDPKTWAQARLRLAEQPITPLLAAFVPEENEDDVEVTQQNGVWKGKAARLFIITHQEVNKPWWNFQSRAVLYADPKTGRFLARQVFCRWPDFADKGDVLLLEAEYDYAMRPVPALFDEVAFAKGAKKVLNLYPDSQGHLTDKEGNEKGALLQK